MMMNNPHHQQQQMMQQHQTVFIGKISLQNKIELQIGSLFARKKMAFWQHCFYFHIYMSKVALSLNNTHDKKRQKEKGKNVKNLVKTFFI